MTDARAFLAERTSPERLRTAVSTLECLQKRTRALAAGRATRVLDRYDGGYGTFFIHKLTDAMREIAREGWVDRQLADIVRLHQSPVLAECCRATVIELFGVESFHVAVQHYPCSDGLVQELCHGHWDKLQHVRRIGGELLYLRVAFGSYPPPGFFSEDRSSSDAPVFDAIPVR